MAETDTTSRTVPETSAGENLNGRRLKTGRALGIPGGRWAQIGYVLTDLLLVCLNAFVVFLLRFAPPEAPGALHTGRLGVPFTQPANVYLGFLLVYAAVIVLLCQSQDLYRTVRTRSAWAESFAVAKAVLFATLLLTAFVYLSGVKTISRLVVGFSSVLNVGTLMAWRLWKRRVVEHRVAQGHGARNVLIVGAGAIGRALAHYLEENKHLGYRVQGFLDQDHQDGSRLLGRIEDLSQVARTHFVDEVFITIPSERELVKSVASEARRQRLDVKVVPDLYDGLGWKAPLQHLGDFPVMALHWEPIPALGLFVKRVMDIVFSCAGLLLLSPVLAAIAFAIKLDSPGSVFYRSVRVGKKGRKFTCYKFRTMVADADARKDQLRHLNERNGPFFKILNDPRVTRPGIFLRKHSLDELPQLWNVLKGDMSLVGPRPHPTDDYQQYSLEHLERLDVKPGVTGLWQVTARRDPSFETNMALDLKYIENWDLWLDLKILLRTLPEVLRASGS
jgi:exopolysaccharide biosynthesis polyprenyl glycosylphosphotransferase